MARIRMFEETPSGNPPSGYLYVYVNPTTHHLMQRDSFGIDTDLSGGESYQRAVIDYVDNSSTPPTEVSGDRYILDDTGGGVHADWDGASIFDIVQFDGTDWIAYSPSEGWRTYVDAEDLDRRYVDDGTPAWEQITAGGAVAHNNTTGKQGGTTDEYYHLTSDEHTALNGMTANRAVITDASGNLFSSTTTDIEIGYVSGATSAIQTQLDAKAIVSGTPADNQLAVWTDDDTIEGSINLTFVNATGLNLSTGNTYQINGIDIMVNSSNWDSAYSHISLTNNPHSVTLGQVGAEAALGNPGTDGYVLSSTIAGTRSWIAPGGGSSSWIALTDTPGSIQSLQLVRGNSGADALEFLDSTTDWLSQYALLTGRSGGQSLTGGTLTTQDLTLEDNAIDNNTITVTEMIAKASTTGTPVNDQLSVFTDANTMEGSANLTFVNATGLNLSTGNAYLINDIDIMTNSSNWDTAYTHSQVSSGNPHSVTLGEVGAEADLGNPGTDGYVLSSTTGGTRSWIEMTGGTSYWQRVSTNLLPLTAGDDIGSTSVYINKIWVRTIEIPDTNSSTAGVIFKGGARWLHNYEPAASDGQNVFIGYNAGNFTMTGSGVNASGNIGFGYLALNALTSGYGNFAAGYNALPVNTTGHNNIAVGLESMKGNISGTYNIAIGRSSLYASTSSHYNLAMGRGALGGCTIGTYNIGLGRNSLVAVTEGEYNIGIGYLAGANITTGDHNICIGDNINAISATSDYQLNIGDTIYGDLSGDRVGIGTIPSANATLVLEGGILSIKETTTPTADINYAKIYSKADNKLYFQDGEGTESEVNIDVGITVSGTPANDQLAVWTDADTLEGSANLTFVNATGLNLSTGNAFLINSVDIMANSSNWDTAYTHSQVSSGNPHSVTLGEVGAEAALGNPGTNGYILSSTTGGTRSWIEMIGGGDVKISGTPVDNQLAVWTTDDTIEGSINLTFVNADGLNISTGNTYQINGIDIVANSSNWDTAYTHSQLTSGNPHSVSYGDTGAEEDLGNPGTDGYVLSSTTGGTRSWIEMTGGGGSSLWQRTGTNLLPLTSGDDIGSTSVHINKIWTQNIEIDVTTASIGIITKGGNRFLHDFAPAAANGRNVFLGIDAGNLTMAGSAGQSSRNVGIGSEVLDALTTGKENLAIGDIALGKLTTGSDNISLGSASGQEITTGSENVFIGRAAGNLVKTGQQNIVIGRNAGVGETNLSEYNYNVLIGSDTAQDMRTGAEYNIFLGYSNDGNAITGSGNILIGSQLLLPTVSTDNYLSIGNTIYGDLSGDRVGIGIVPLANATLTLEGGSLALKETTTPTADTDYAKIYSKADNKLYFQDGAGIEHEIGGGSAITASGTPVDDQLAVWTNANTIEGTANLTFVNATGLNLSSGNAYLINDVDIMTNSSNWDTAYTHSQVSSGNPHSIAYSDTGAEADLGNPGTDGYVLSSTIAGTRSWIASGSGYWQRVSTNLLPNTTGDDIGSTSVYINKIWSTTLEMPNTINSTIGVIFRGGSRWMHNYKGGTSNGHNIFIGEDSGNFSMSGSVVTGSENVGLGYQTLLALTTGYGNFAAGLTAGTAVTTGHNNFMAGLESSKALTTGTYNITIGRATMSVATAAHYNIAMGRGALGACTTGQFNIAFNRNSLVGVTDGNGNIGIGYSAGDNITTGDYNIIIGYDINALSATSNNQLNIGDTIYGDMANARLGIGVGPSANAGLVIEDGALSLKERVTPTADTNYGKIYTKTDDKLYFQDGSGTEHEIAFV